jgi:hypothetical protein
MGLQHAPDLEQGRDGHEHAVGGGDGAERIGHGRLLNNVRRRSVVRDRVR